MALKIDTTYKAIVVPNSYVIVARMAISDDKSTLSFGAWYKVSQVAEMFKAVSYTMPYNIEGDDPFSQAYTYLKTLPEFAGAVDV